MSEIFENKRYRAEEGKECEDLTVAQEVFELEDYPTKEDEGQAISDHDSETTTTASNMSSIEDTKRPNLSDESIITERKSSYSKAIHDHTQHQMRAHSSGGIKAYSRDMHSLMLNQLIDYYNRRIDEAESPILGSIRWSTPQDPSPGFELDRLTLEGHSSPSPDTPEIVRHDSGETTHQIAIPKMKRRASEPSVFLGSFHEFG